MIVLIKNSIFKYLLLAVFALTTISMQAKVGDIFTANTAEGVELTFEVTDESKKTCALGVSGQKIPTKKYLGTQKLTIPAAVNGYSVNFINAFEFYGSDITEITFYGDIIIGYCAFMNCRKLKSVTFNGHGSGEMTGFFPAAFYGCTSLEEIELPKGMKELYLGTFGGCSNLRSLVIPETLERIHMSDEIDSYHNFATFWYDGNNFEELINFEKDQAIQYGKDWKEDLSHGYYNYLVDDYYGIFLTPFDDVNPYFQIKISEKNPYLVVKDGVIYNKDFTELICCPVGINDGIDASIVIPETVKRIGNFAFWGVWEYHGRGSLDYKKIVSVKMPASVKEIGEGAFNNCSMSLTVDENNPYFSRESQFLLTKERTELIAYFEDLLPDNIPSTVKKIGNFAFYGRDYSKYSSLQIIPNSVEEIGTLAFAKSTLGETVIANSNSTIGWGAFSGTKFVNNTTISLPEGMLEMPMALFRGSELTHIQLPSSLITTGDFISCAFYNCIYLKEVILPESLKIFGIYTFYGCKELESIIIPGSLQRINSYAFQNCSSLASISLPASLTAIEDDAFSGCSSIKGIVFPDNVTLGQNAFMGCSALETISLPKNLSEISSGLLADCVSLHKLDIPSGVTNIGDGAFKNCISLESLMIPDDVNYIGKDVIAGCSSLKSLVLPKNGTVYSSYDGCLSLSGITLPESWPTDVNNFNGFSLDESGISSIVVQSQTPPQKENGTFEVFSTDDEVLKKQYYENVLLYVPQGAKEAYRGADGWKDFQNIQEIDINRFGLKKDSIVFSLDIRDREAALGVIGKNAAEVIVDSIVNFSGVDYPISSIEGPLFMEESNDQQYNYVEFPSTIKIVKDNAFNKCAASSFIWTSDMKLSEGMFGDERYQKNFLLYTNSPDIAPTNITNVIANGEADNIVLHDGYRFYCPQTFHARNISYSHNYKMTTGVNGTCCGWETIALPFDVETVRHNDGRQLVPFLSYMNVSETRPYWLCALTENGFENASEIKANTPYLISMPNNSLYANDYNLAGEITFTGKDVLIDRTTTNSLNMVSYDGYIFSPCYDIRDKQADDYALNVTNDYSVNTSSEDLDGSVFLKNSRKLNPFEGFFRKSQAQMPKLCIPFTNLSTDVKLYRNTSEALCDDGSLPIYNISGQKMQKSTPNLRKGIYVIKGKKKLVK